jgi:hypothetical protein
VKPPPPIPQCCMTSAYAAPPCRTTPRERIDGVRPVEGRQPCPPRTLLLCPVPCRPPHTHKAHTQRLAIHTHTHITAPTCKLAICVSTVSNPSLSAEPLPPWPAAAATVMHPLPLLRCAILLCATVPLCRCCFPFSACGGLRPRLSAAATARIGLRGHPTPFVRTQCPVLKAPLQCHAL